MKNKDKPAYPEPNLAFLRGMAAEDAKKFTGQFGGLTKREYFAGLAMGAILSNTVLCKALANVTDGEPSDINKTIALQSVEAADALLEALDEC